MRYENVPFVDFEENSKAVHWLNYPVEIKTADGKSSPGVLQLWIQYEKPYYFLYISVLEPESMGYSILIDGSNRHAKIRLMEAERNTKEKYYQAGTKASVWCKKLVAELCPEVRVKWQEGIAKEKRMGENLARASRCMYEEVKADFFEKEEGQ